MQGFLGGQVLPLQHGQVYTNSRQPNHKCFTGEQTAPGVVQGEPQAKSAAQPVADIAAAAATATATAGKKPQATPAVRRIASEHNVSRKFVL